MSYRDLADRIRVSQPCTGASRVVAVDGPAGSGKSLFAERLSTVLSAKVICLDDLTPSWTGPDKEADLLVQQVLVRFRGAWPLSFISSTGSRTDTPSGAMCRPIRSCWSRVSERDRGSFGRSSAN